MLVVFGVVYPIFLTATVRATVFAAFKVHANSMEPGLLAGDRVLANKLVVGRREPRVGDVIIFRNPHDRHQCYVKRIAAVAGESIRTEEHVSSRSETLETAEIAVPTGRVFVLGDNRENSKDSREFGPLPVGDIVGYVDYIYWPAKGWHRFGAL